MTANLGRIFHEVENLSFDELLTLQEYIIRQLRVKPLVNNQPRVSQPPLQLNAYAWNNWPPDATFRREEIYDDDGR